MRIKRPVPSDAPMPYTQSKGKRKAKRSPRFHVFDTEARSLEEACDIIAEANRNKKISDRAKNHTMSLRQKLGMSKGLSHLTAAKGQISLANGAHNKPHPRFDPSLRKPKTPHPFRDLPPEAKAAKAKDMYHSGAWGYHKRACYHLSRLFGVTIDQIALWAEQ